MNLLVDAVPNEITVDNVSYAIRTDYRIWIMFEQLLLDDTINDNDKNQAVYNLLFPDVAPPQTNEAISKILDFYCCGKTGSLIVNETSSNSRRCIYDYDVDDEYIYSAFLQQYSIDLQMVNHLHWWQYRALFKGLTDKCKISEIMSYRALDVNTVPKSQRPFYRKMQKLYALPLSADEIEKNDLIEDALLQGKSVNNLL